MKAVSPELSVLIVDDNEPVCRSLSKSSIWKSLAARVRGTATSSAEAKVLIRRIRPEILITDIKMPGTDGIALSAYARSIVSDCRVIFITAYDEFELAQRAVRVDAADFILKPIHDHEVARAVRKIVSEFTDTREKGREAELLRIRYGQVEEQVRIMELQARRQLVSELLRGTLVGKTAAQEQMRKLGLKLHRYQVLVAVETDGSAVGRSWQHRIAQLFERERTAERWDEVTNLLTLVIDDRLVVVTDINEACAETRRKEIVTELAFLVQEVTIRGGSPSKLSGPPEANLVRIVLGVGAVHSEPHSLRRAYEEAVFAADQHFFESGTFLRFFTEIAQSASFREDHLRRQVELIQAALSEWKNDESERVLEDRIGAFFDELRTARHLGREYAESKLRDLAGLLKNKGGVDVNNRLGGAMDLALSSFESLDEARIAFVTALRKSMGVMRDAAKPLQQHHIGLAVEFLESRYSEPVRLADVAHAVGLSPAHLSRLISKTTGKSFTELLTSIRINAAAKLLRETNAKVYEIADMVGLKNHAYFYQIFRKHTGLSPNELR